MSLNIKNERTHALVRELATLQGVRQTEAVELAVRARLDELNDERETQRRFDMTMEISRETGRIIRESGGSFSTDDLYDDMGLPR